MTDIGAGWAHMGAAPAIPLPGSILGRRMRQWWTAVAHAARASIATRPQRRDTGPHYYHPRREGYAEDAAMRREMYRL